MSAERQFHRHRRAAVAVAVSVGHLQRRRRGSAPAITGATPIRSLDAIIDKAAMTLDDGKRDALLAEAYEYAIGAAGRGDPDAVPDHHLGDAQGHRPMAASRRRRRWPHWCMRPSDDGTNVTVAVRCGRWRVADAPHRRVCALDQAVGVRGRGRQPALCSERGWTSTGSPRSCCITMRISVCRDARWCRWTTRRCVASRIRSHAPRLRAYAAGWCMSGLALTRISRGTMCGGASCWSMGSQRRQCRCGPRARGRSGSCISVRTSICTRCASRQCGGTRRRRRLENYPRPWCAVCCCPMVRRCANGWRAASSRR